MGIKKCNGPLRFCVSVDLLNIRSLSHILANGRDSVAVEIGGGGVYEQRHTQAHEVTSKSRCIVYAELILTLRVVCRLGAKYYSSK